jgi:hypothetical protein
MQRISRCCYESLAARNAAGWSAWWKCVQTWSRYSGAINHQLLFFIKKTGAYFTAVYKQSRDSEVFVLFFFFFCRLVTVCSDSKPKTEP